MNSRSYDRSFEQTRPVTFERDYTQFAHGSVLVSFGRTKVLCTASVEQDVPRFLKGTSKGWVTAEYSMLPGSTIGRATREAAKGKQSGRTQEIQRLIGRSLRCVTDLKALGERQIVLDCDVLQADGGTRTAAICGAWVALHDACTRLVAEGQIKTNPIISGCAAVSVGIVKGVGLCDLDYSEDSIADVDFNIVMNSKGEFIELQGTAEQVPFSRERLNELLDLGASGISSVMKLQNDVVSIAPPARSLS